MASYTHRESRIVRFDAHFSLQHLVDADAVMSIYLGGGFSFREVLCSSVISGFTLYTCVLAFFSKAFFVKLTHSVVGSFI